MKSDKERIGFYLRKVNAYMGVHPSKSKNQYRHQRLVTYKEMMNKQLKQSLAKKHG